MRALITGSSGQIGTNLALRCLGEGYEVLGVDRRQNTWTDLVDLRLEDLVSPGALLELEHFNPDVVVHLAGHAKVHQLVREPQLALENMVMTHNVLEYCRRQRVPVIFASSREVYGDLLCSTTEEKDADHAFAKSTYSASKLAGEAMVQAYARCFEIPFIVLRLSNVYGRFDNDLDRMERVLPLFIRKIRQDEPVTIYGAEKVLDFTYVDDCVDGVMRAMQCLTLRQVCNQTFNLAFGEGYTLMQAVEYLGAALNKTPRVHVAPTRVGEVTRYVANLNRARAELGFHPKVPLSEGLARSVAWSLNWEALHSKTELLTLQPPSTLEQSFLGRV